MTGSRVNRCDRRLRQGIPRQAEGRLSKEAQLKKIDVLTDGGAVILTGAVPSIGPSVRASELARGVPGGRMIKNELTYDAAKSDGARATTTGSHAQVMGMQQALKDKGVEPGPMDGVMGPRTASVPKEYQKSENLTINGGEYGIAGPNVHSRVTSD